MSGARICGLPARLNRYLSGRTAPNILVVHLGTNDIFHMSKRQIMKVLSETLTFLRQRLPQVMLVWSEILPRLFWYGEHKRGRGNKVRVDINRHAASLMKALPGDNRVIYYPAFHNRPHRLFRYDGVHLSSMGNQMFRSQIQQALRYFQAQSMEVGPNYPPL